MNRMIHASVVAFFAAASISAFAQRTPEKSPAFELNVLLEIEYPAETDEIIKLQKKLNSKQQNLRKKIRTRTSERTGKWAVLAGIPEKRKELEEEIGKFYDYQIKMISGYLKKELPPEKRKVAQEILTRMNNTGKKDFINTIIDRLQGNRKNRTSSRNAN